MGTQSWHELLLQHWLPVLQHWQWHWQQQLQQQQQQQQRHSWHQQHEQT